MTETENTTIKTFTADALGLSSGKPILIPFTLEGEEVRISNPFKKKGMRFAEALEILKPSPDRRAPFCPHFGTCGGCLTQHLAYEKELLWKENRIKELFSSFKGVEIAPILPAPAMQGWRNKMEFSFSHKGELGLYRFFGKRSIFDIQHCSLGPDWFQEAANSFRAFQKQAGLLPFDSHSNQGSLRHLTVRHGHRSGDRLLFLTVSGDPAYAWKKEQLEAFKEKGKALGASVFLVIQQAIRGHPTQYFEMHLHGKDSILEKLKVGDRELSFQISPRAFFQPNPIQAEKLYQKTFELLDLKGDELLVDLFAGTGTIGLFGAHLVKKVISVELSSEACLDAEENRKLNKVENLEIIQGDVGAILDKGIIEAPDVLIVDPPRAGLLDDAVKAIIRLKPQKIAYISCNPNTQAEDIFKLVEAGYELLVLQPVDQFPRSPHVENIALLSRKL